MKKSKAQAEALKGAIFRTFNEMQEVNRETGRPEPWSLIEWAHANPKEFYTGLLPRVIPKPVEISAGEGVSFALVYQVGDQQLVIGADGQAKALPDPGVIDVEAEEAGPLASEAERPVPERPVGTGSKDER